MKNKKLLVVVLGSAMSMAFAIPAGAQDKPGGYVGGSIGQATADVSGCSGSCDDTATAFRILGGYQFNRNFAVEGGYHNFGKVITFSGGHVKASAFEVVGVGAYPFSPEFSVYGKLGLYYGEAKAGGSFSSDSETSTEMTFGLGVQYNVSPQLGIRGEFQNYDNVGGSRGLGDDINVISIGVIFKF